MAKPRKWTPELYKLALKNLRPVAKGFDAADGFNLTKIADWTPAQKRLVRRYDSHLSKLMGVNRTLVRFRNEENRKRAQQGYHGGVPGNDRWKGAFVPVFVPKPTLPGAKTIRPKVRMTKTGIVATYRNMERVDIPFDKQRLASNATKEIARVASLMPDDVKLYYLSMGGFQSVNPAGGLRAITSRILYLMNRYDGIKVIHRNENPRHHHWNQWLDGLIGYSTKGDEMTAAREIMRGRQAYREEKIKRERQRDRAERGEKISEPKRKPAVKRKRKPVVKRKR